MNSYDINMFLNKFAGKKIKENPNNLYNYQFSKDITDEEFLDFANKLKTFSGFIQLSTSPEKPSVMKKIIAILKK